MRQRIFFLFIALIVVLGTQKAFAAETDILANVLKKVDGLICTSPNKIKQYYGKNLVIMEGDRRGSLTRTIEGYEGMIATFDDMKCDFTRKVLAGEVGEKIGYIMVDEIIKIHDRLSRGERQHNFCSYIFSKKEGPWKISQQHCIELPEYYLPPDGNGLDYFHSLVY